MGIEIPREFNGAEMSFTSSIIAIEEISKVDPGVGVICDVHNTLINTLFRQYGNEEQKKKYLPRLSTDMVSLICLS